jgi:hypothetical protein
VGRGERKMKNTLDSLLNTYKDNLNVMYWNEDYGVVQSLEEWIHHYDTLKTDEAFLILLSPLIPVRKAKEEERGGDACFCFMASAGEMEFWKEI